MIKGGEKVRSEIYVIYNSGLKDYFPFPSPQIIRKYIRFDKRQIIVKNINRQHVLK